MLEKPSNKELRKAAENLRSWSLVFCIFALVPFLGFVISAFREMMIDMIFYAVGVILLISISNYFSNMEYFNKIRLEIRRS